MVVVSIWSDWLIGLVAAIGISFETSLVMIYMDWSGDICHGSCSGSYDAVQSTNELFVCGI